MQIHPKLTHLSVEQITDLLKKFDDPSYPLKDIISEFSLKTTPGALNGLLPPLIHEDSPCPYCTEIVLYSRRPTRSGRVSPGKYCPVCGHKDANYCYCQNCSEIRAKDREWLEGTKRDIIRENFRVRDWHGDIECLTLRDAVYISALVRQSLSEDLMRVEPYALGPPKLAPTEDYTRDIIKHLKGKALLAVDPESPIDAFVFDADLNEAHSYYPQKVDWLFLPGVDAPHRKNFLRDLATAIDGDWSVAWKADVPRMWREIIKAEAFEYFFHMLHQRGYQLDSIGEKTHTVFDFLIDRFPLSKIYNLTWQAVRDITDFNVKNSIPTYRGKNNFLGAIQGKADRYIAEEWDLKDARRDFGCPQTIISSTFFDAFMKVGQHGFTSMPPAHVD
jgi:hypothetical protein